MLVEELVVVMAVLNFYTLNVVRFRLVILLNNVIDTVPEIPLFSVIVVCCFEFNLLSLIVGLVASGKARLLYLFKLSFHNIAMKYNYYF